MKSHLFTVCFCLIAVSCFAQTDSHPSSFWNHYDQFNPAMTGLQYRHHGAMTYRNQNPSLSVRSQTLNANYGTKMGLHHGLGINSRVQSDYFSNNLRVALNYNYQLLLKENHIVSLGAGIGIDDHAIRPVFYGENPSFFTARTDLDFTTGVAYSNKKLLLGVGITRIGDIQLRVKGQEESYNPFIQREQLYLTAAYSIQLSQNLELKPQTLIQTDFDFTSIDFNLLLTLKKKYWLGASFNGNRIFSGTIGYDIKEKYRIGYAYQHYFSQLNGFDRGKHEFTLGFLLR